MQKKLCGIFYVCACTIFLINFVPSKQFDADKLSIKPILKRKKYEPLALSPVMNPKHLLIIRVIFTMYALTAWIINAIVGFPFTFSYYTVWNYTVLTFYFCSASIFSIITIYSKQGVASGKYFNYYRGLVWTLFQVECALALLVDLTVWCILAPASGHPIWFLSFDSVSMHILNVVFLYIELFVNSIPIHFHFGVFAVSAPLVYMVWSWLYYHLDTKWDYFFLDPSKDIDAMWMLIVFAMHLLSWLFVWKIGAWKHKRFMRNTAFVPEMSVNSGEDVVNRDYDVLQASSSSLVGADGLITTTTP